MNHNNKKIVVVSYPGLFFRGL